MAQTNFFGSFVKHSIDFPAPYTSVPEADSLYIDMQIEAQVSAALSFPPGPVHFNLRFREPLLPHKNEESAIEAITITAKNSNRPASCYQPSEQFINSIAAANSVAIFLGHIENITSCSKELNELLQKNHITLFAENSAYLVGNQCQQNSLVTGLELIAKSLQQNETYSFDLGIVLGNVSVGRGYELLIEKFEFLQLFALGKSATVNIPTLKKCQAETCDPLDFIKNSKDIFQNKAEVPASKKIILEQQEKLRQAVAVIVAENETETITQYAFFTTLAETIESSSQQALFIGNSLPIRDFNKVSEWQQKAIPVISNRGLSGIDGLISTSIGYAFGAHKQTVTILGDLSFMHDVSGFLALKQNLSATVNKLIVLDNQGGGIFRSLGASKPTETRLVANPEMDILPLVRSLFPRSLELRITNELLPKLQSFLLEATSNVMVVRINVEHDQAIRKKISETLNNLSLQNL